MDKEAKRAEVIGLVDKSDNAVPFINKLMKEATSQVLLIALKYFFYLALRPGWSILQVVDPHEGPGAAASILKALMQLGIVKEEQILYRVLVPVEAHQLPFAAVIPCESDSESDSDDGKSDDENSVIDEGSSQKEHGDDDEGVWPRSGPRTKEPKLVGWRAGNGGTKESNVVRITLLLMVTVKE